MGPQRPWFVRWGVGDREGHREGLAWSPQQALPDSRPQIWMLVLAQPLSMPQRSYAFLPLGPGQGCLLHWRG